MALRRHAPDDMRQDTPPQRSSQPHGDVDPHPVLELQRTVGNTAVTALLGRGAAAATVQRRTEPGEGSSQGGYLPHHEGPKPVAKPKETTAPGVAEHLMSAAETADLPSTADAPGLLAERKQIVAARAAREQAFDAAQARGESPDPATKSFTAEETTRIAEIDRLLRIRKKGDEEETLKANGVTTGHAAWFAEVKSYTFLGKSIVCHRLLYERLQRAENRLSGKPVPAGGWFTNVHSLRKVGESLHSFGLAMDIDGGRNPFLINPDAAHASLYERAATSRAIADVINRAILLVEARTPQEADFQSRPTDTDRNARAMASYDKVAQASASLKTYMTLDQADQRATLDRHVTALAGKDSRTAERWIATIRADRRTLTRLAEGKDWTQPTEGFMTLNRDLVEALTHSDGGGLTWLGDDTIGSGRDIMHFDMRGLGPIRKIVKSATKETVGLGSG